MKVVYSNAVFKDCVSSEDTHLYILLSACIILLPVMMKDHQPLLKSQISNLGINFYVMKKSI